MPVIMIARHKYARLQAPAAYLRQHQGIRYHVSLTLAQVCGAGIAGCVLVPDASYNDCQAKVRQATGPGGILAPASRDQENQEASFTPF